MFEKIKTYKILMQYTGIKYQLLNMSKLYRQRDGTFALFSIPWEYAFANPFGAGLLNIAKNSRGLAVVRGMFALGLD